MNQLFYNMATTAWASRLVLLLIDHNKFSRSTVKENKGLYYRTCNTTQSVKQQLKKKVNPVSKIVNEKFAFRIKLSKRSQTIYEYSMKRRTKSNYSQSTHLYQAKSKA